MGWNILTSILCLFLLMDVYATSVFASTFISDSIFESRASTARTLLQTTKGCPVNFEFLNYTIITSQCKGPQYPPDRCCGSFKEFACPYADVLNDLTNDCASTMFSYINLYGKYPPGLFANECRDSKRGLECAVAPSAHLDDKSGSQTIHNAPLLLSFISGFAIFLLQII